METSLAEILQKIDNKLSNKFSTTMKVSSRKSDFTKEYPVPLELSNELSYEFGLHWIATYNSIYNVGAYKFAYSLDGVTFIEKTTTSGAYSVEGIGKDINDKIITDLKNEKNAITLIPNISIGKCLLVCKGLSYFKFSKELANILGFTAGTPYPSGSHMGEHFVNISSVSDINIECDLIEGSYDNGILGNILYSFPSHTVPFGFKLVERMNPPIFFPISRKCISSIRFRILDQDGNLISFNNDKIILYMQLKQV